MRLRAIVALALFVTACGSDSGGPLDPWTGTWKLVSVNGQPLPADITIDGYPSRVVSRTLTLLRGAGGSWSDSTLSARNCSPPSKTSAPCNASGRANIIWSTGDAALTIVPTASTTAGVVAAIKFFVLQEDRSTLLKTDDNQTEVYRRQ